MGLTMRVRGNWNRTKEFLEKMKSQFYIPIIQRYGEIGCRALAEYTPKDTGATASSWYYVIKRMNKGFKIEWRNYHLDDDGRVPVAILIQFGHGTGTGGYVAPRDFINPALQPIFENLAEAVWEEVCNS